MQQRKKGVGHNSGDEIIHNSEERQRKGRVNHNGGDEVSHKGEDQSQKEGISHNSGDEIITVTTTATAIHEGANRTGGVLAKIGESPKVVETTTAMVVKSPAVV